MIAVLCALAGISVLLFTAEILWHRKYISGEYARKFVHILGGSFVAFWPYFLDFGTIRWIAFAGIVLWVATKKLNLTFALKDINRPTVGELLYPVSVYLVALVAADKWVFTVSILFLALADGMAAVIGKKFGTKQLTYKVPKGKKTIQGSLAYLVCGYVAITIGCLLGGNAAILNSPILTLVWLPLACVILENISPLGTDNLTVPIVVATVLNLALTMSLF